MKILNHINDIAIDKHGLIEASAGTGKTYTIENLAIRIIKEKKITIDKILIVTFTEKATGELRQRLRAKLEEECHKEKNRELLELLHHSLDHFDQTSIFTMHSFCHSILKDFSFEMAENFQPIIANNNDIYLEILEKDIRKKWPIVFGDTLLSILNLFKFDEASFADKILRICNLMRLHQQFSLLPLPKDISSTLFKEIQECIDQIIKLSPLINLNTFQVAKENVLSDFLKGKSETYFNNKLIQLLQWNQNKNCLLSRIPFAKISLKVAKKNTDMVLYKLVENIYVLLEKIDFLEESSQLQFVSWVVTEVLNASKVHKIENNLIAYDDMILKTEAIISKKVGNENVLNKIRDMYHYGMIDEFQDTDLFQWSIFKSIFINSPNSFLFLIGDPKQSIYRFRNADIHTYLEAKELIEKLQKENKGDLYSLNINYRSFSALIDDFNYCFKSPNWFGLPSKNFKIDYVESKSSNNVDKHTNLLNISKPGFKLIEITQINAPDFFNEYSQKIVQEIIRLKNLYPQINYGDFCCLYDVKKNMNYLITQLKKNRIPFSIYQEEGISNSPEAIEISYLLNAIFSPHNEAKRSLALITSFFQIAPKELSNYRELNADHEILRKLLYWHSLGQKRQWAKMFQSIIEETGIIAYCISQPEGERKIANFKQITEWLELKAYENKLSLWDLCILINEYKVNPNSLSDDEKKMRLNSESKKVQLMTIHVSKGLEFPFVFYCKYTPQGRHTNSFWIRQNNQYLIVTDPNDIQFQEAYSMEQYEEQKRLLYVTFTRAIHSLYMPFCEDSKDQDFKSIVQDFVVENKDHFEMIQDVVGNVGGSKQKPDLLLPTIEPKIDWAFEEIPRHRLYDHMNINSYSQLSEKEKKLTHVNIDKTDARFDDDDNQEVVEEVLPKGANTGNFFHYLFETVSFSEIEVLAKGTAESNKLIEHIETNQIIDQAMNDYQIDKKWKEAVCQILFDSLTKNIYPFDKDFHLSQLTDKQRIHEMEFYYPTHASKKLVEPPAFMKGFIDLIFEWQGKYYILDWKSNYIAEGYQMPALEKAMAEHQYDLQYCVYSVCLYRWLKTRGMKESDWLSKFGGIIYLFIRGAPESLGCYFKPSEEIPSIEENLKKIIFLMGS